MLLRISVALRYRLEAHNVLLERLRG